MPKPTPSQSIKSHEESHTTLSLPILIEEPAGIERFDEPVTVGIPFPSGGVLKPSQLRLRDQEGASRPLQAEALSRWPDNSVKWALLDFQTCLKAYEKATLHLEYIPDKAPESPSQKLKLRQIANTIKVDTGVAIFFINQSVLKPFDRVVVQERDILETSGSRLSLTDASGQVCEPRIQDCSIETSGDLRATVRLEGEFRNSSSGVLARFVARLSFYVNSNLAQMQITLHNPRAAHHPGGLWDLGDKGSIIFQDLSLSVPFLSDQEAHNRWLVRPEQPAWEQTSTPIEIYQDSSGGENWLSSNHVNRFGNVMHSFRGYRVTTNDEIAQEGDRALPILAVHDRHRSITATIKQFWQNFPKALEVEYHQLTVRLFPKQYNDVYELQGGEQKTHTIYLQFGDPAICHENLRWVHHPLIPKTTPEWYTRSRAFPYLTPQSQEQHPEALSLIETAIKGPKSFSARREVIDEYGWRHFGELYADHEAVGHTGDAPRISHYNNQYDPIYGAIIQYARNGDRRWFELMHDLAKHVIDIDIYHTQEDRPAYNGGLFWHTDHYVDAATGTHRAYSKANLGSRTSQNYGGGPSNEHNYTTGLLHYYFLTGDTLAREAAQGLANWVINIDRRSQTLLGRFDKRPTGLCSSTASRDYHGPGRGSGNSVNALLDAYTLSREERYLIKTEEIIRRCIHPQDNIAKHHLDNIEYRWSYTVFLQALGKYLDIKATENDIDYMYSYAQSSLLHYAEWMLINETPYACVLDRVEIPTETWPAQDIRKSHIFYLAAKHTSEPRRSAFQEKAAFFFDACLRDLYTFPTHQLTRPIVLLMTNAYIRSYFERHPEETAPKSQQHYSFDNHRAFTPQFYELYWLREKLLALL